MTDHEKQISQAKTELSKTDSEGLPPSVAYRLEYCVPLALDLILEGDTTDGGNFRIPIELDSTNIVTAILIPNHAQNTLTIQVLTSTSTTPNY